MEREERGGEKERGAGDVGRRGGERKERGGEGEKRERWRERDWSGDVERERKINHTTENVNACVSFRYKYPQYNSDIPLLC